jgi:hypothetical protein
MPIKYFFLLLYLYPPICFLDVDNVAGATSTFCINNKDRPGCKKLFGTLPLKM